MPRVSRLLRSASLGAALGACLLVTAPAAENNPVRRAAAGDSSTAARVIVKYRARAHALAAGTASRAGFPRGASDLARRLQVPLVDGRGLGPRTQVLTASGLTSAELAARLSREADVEWAVVDGRRHPLYVPADPLYGEGQTLPASPHGQWYLRAPNAQDNVGVASAIDAEHAWDITRGLADFVIADVDTGITVHPDLQNQLFYSGGVPYGYDFIGYSLASGETQTDAILTANDGSLDDSNPSDPGDWINAADQTESTFPATQCPQENSSWHGTQTAGVLAAQADDNIGMSGVAPNAKIVPVRVLGKCGGYDSDIIAGMEWAAGVAVDGVQANLHPSRVINMSLGGSGDCTAAYQDAIATLTGLNVAVVVAAGNDEGLPLGAPANCSGVLAVVGLRHVGDKVGFSNLGSAAAPATIAAPGGNCVNETGACLYPILTTSNTGTTSPLSPTYTDSGASASLGTSFSAPMVSGTLALMMSVSPDLTLPELVTVLQGTSTPFPTTGGTSGTPVCAPPSASVTQDECYCTTTTCGAGMLNARAAVTQALFPYPVVQSPDSANVGDTVTLSAASSVVARGRTIVSEAWQLVGGADVATLNGASGSEVTLTGQGAGVATVQLTVTDDGHRASTITRSVTFNAPNSGDGGGGAANPLWLLGLALAGLALAPRRALRARPGA